MTKSVGTGSGESVSASRPLYLPSRSPGSPSSAGGVCISPTSSACDAATTSRRGRAIASRSQALPRQQASDRPRRPWLDVCGAPRGGAETGNWKLEIGGAAERDRCHSPEFPVSSLQFHDCRVGQRPARLVHTQEVAGSTPAPATIYPTARSRRMHRRGGWHGARACIPRGRSRLAAGNRQFPVSNFQFPLLRRAAS